jgi:hypothetical protein
MAPAVRSRRFGGLGAMIAAVALLAGGCESPLDTEIPEIVTPENLEGPEAIPTLVQGAFGDFSLAYTGAPAQQQGIVLVTGLFTDEFIHSGTFNTRNEIDTREIDVRNAQMILVFRNLQRARRAAEKTADFIEANADDPTADSRLSRMYNLAGLSYVLIGESFCSGVPFSLASEDGTFEFGEPTTTAGIYDLALARFESARATAATAGSSEDEYLADLGTARVLLDRGDYVGAAAAAATVPTEFVFHLDHSINSLRQENGIFNLNAVFERWSVGSNEGVNGIDFLSNGGVMDIRVPWIRSGGTDVGFDRATPQRDLLKYPGRDKASIVATGVEARLIEAEVALWSGDDATWLAALNNLRDNVADLLTRDHLDALRDNFGIEGSDVQLSPLSDPGTPASRVDLHFSERAFWLYATAQRLSDLRRLVREYGRTAESVFPTGAYFKGGLYGPDVNLIVPFDEQNNPNFESCLDRGA